MPSERVRRRIDRLLDDAEQALDDGDWIRAQSAAQGVLDLDPNNSDALTFIDVAMLDVGGETRVPPDLSPGPFPSSGGPEQPSGEGETARPEPVEGPAIPTSFAAGRYQVKRLLGEGGKKRVYLAHDTLLDRDVAFALIKTEGLDQTARDRIAREAQAMGRLGAHPHIVTVFDLGEEPAEGTGNRGPGTVGSFPLPQGEGEHPSLSRAGETPVLPDARAEALAHLDFAIAEFREMKMQPSLERALRHRELLTA